MAAEDGTVDDGIGDDGARVVSRGFEGRRRQDGYGQRLPPGQYVEEGFPVLSAWATPRVDRAEWDLVITDGDDRVLARWTWNEFLVLPSEDVTVDIHCVTSWSKFDTRWRGVSVDTLVAGLDVDPAFVVAVSADGYTTNLPYDDVVDGRAWVAHAYDGEDLEVEHGGPARLLVPHLYFWKSAKWIRALRLLEEDEPGFWEVNGYHNRGDPWLEQRYRGD
jgi:DMSO/TMAO reductase YedYZ molybdopterin-dependent catalytic subunit